MRFCALQLYLVFLPKYSVQSQTCPEINIGTHIDYNNVVSYGTVAESWNKGEHKRSGIIRQNRETDYFYIKYNKMPSNVEPYSVVSLNSTNTEYAYTIFKVDAESKHVLVISVIYICIPIISSILDIVMEFTIKGCDPFKIYWEKNCGNMLSPIPGLQAKQDTENIKDIQLLRNGFFDVLDDRLSPSNPMMNNQNIEDNKLEFRFYIDIDDDTTKYFFP